MNIKPVAPKSGFRALAAGLYVLVIKNLLENRLEAKSECPWIDQTKEIKVQLEHEKGSVIHTFHQAGFVSQADYAKDGILFGQAVPKVCEFLSSVNSENKEELYLCKKDKQGNWNRIPHTVSFVSYKGKNVVMDDSKIDALIENGEDIEILKESKSRIAQRMFNEFAFLCDVQPSAEGEEITFEDFKDLTIGARVETKPYGDGKEYSFIKRFSTAEAMEFELAKETI